MTALSAPGRAVPTGRAAWAGGAALLLVIGTGMLAPRIALHGWLIAFASVGGIPLGALAWIAIHRLTGGRWGEVARAPLVSAIAVLPLVLLACGPILLFAPLVYPWAADPGSAGPEVADRYLNVGFLALRSLVGLGVLATLSVVETRGRFGRLCGGLALVVYAIFVDVSAFDWLLSLEPRFTSSAFGVQLAVQHLLSALAFTILTVRAPDQDAVWPDLAGLLLATVLGEAYLMLMSFIVSWYGDLPEQAAWYLRRGHGGWMALEVAGLAIGALGPLAALLFARVRSGPGLLRPVAAATLVGVVLQDIWLVAPATEGASAIAGLVAVAAMAGLFLALSGPLARLTKGPHHDG